MKTLIIIFLAVNLSACATKVYLTDQSFITPVTRGKLFAGNLGFSSRGTTEVVLSNSNATAAVDILTPHIRSESAASIKLSSTYAELDMGLFEYLDLFYNHGLGLKFGTPPEGNPIKAALAASSIGMSQTTTEGAIIVENKNTQTWVAGSVGFKDDKKNLLYYLSYVGEKVKSTTKIQNLTTITTYDDDGEHNKINLGIEGRTGAGSLIGLEISQTETKYPRASTRYGFSAGLRVAVGF